MPLRRGRLHWLRGVVRAGTTAPGVLVCPQVGTRASLLRVLSEAVLAGIIDPVPLASPPQTIAAMLMLKWAAPVLPATIGREVPVFRIEA